MQRLLARAPVMAAPGGLAVDGDQLGRVRPSLADPTHEAGREHLRIHAVHQRAQPIRAGDAMKIGQEAAQAHLLANSSDWLKAAPMRENLLASWRQSGQKQDLCPSLLNHNANYKRLLPPCCDFANGVPSFAQQQSTPKLA